MIWLFSLFALLVGCQHKELVQDNLYILHAHTGTLTRDATAVNKATLVMRNVNQDVAYFSPTPNRKAGTLTLSSFLARWNQTEESQKEAPQSAGFVFFDKDGKEYDHEAIKLLFPQYDRASNTLIVLLESMNQDFPFAQKELNEVTLFLNLKL